MHGSMSVALTALVIAIVILLNVLFTALASKFVWYVDMTSENDFTLSQECIDLIRTEITQLNEERASRDEEAAQVKIIFCDTPDNIEDNYYLRYVHHTALELADEFDFITVEYIDIWHNPTAVNKYRNTSQTYIYSTNVIIESGSEYRVHALTNMFISNDDGTYWAYDGEKKISASIFAVTSAEKPLACITTNHGEAFTDVNFLVSLADAGYDVQPIDLVTEEIPEKCRMMIIYDPQSDFLCSSSDTSGLTDIDEIEKLDKYLDNSNSLMVFMGPTSPVLTNLEEYLAEWGITFDRYINTDMNEAYGYTIVESAANSITTNGTSVIGTYTEGGLGASLHEDLRNTSYPPKVIFKDAMSISYSEQFETVQATPEDDTTESTTENTYWYGTYYEDGVSRSIYDIFVSSPYAQAYSNGVAVENATTQNPFKLMTITCEDDIQQEGNYATTNDASYVLACGSLDFVKEAFLVSNSYGNNEILNCALRQMGREVIPVTLDFRPFAHTDIETITAAQTTQYTVVLAVVPAVLIFGTGIFVLLRRKYS